MEITQVKLAHDQTALQLQRQNKWVTILTRERDNLKELLVIFGGCRGFLGVQQTFSAEETNVDEKLALEIKVPLASLLVDNMCLTVVGPH